MEIHGKTVEIFKAQKAQAPLVIVNSYQRSNGALYQTCKALDCPDFTLAEISGIAWNDELSPWAIAPIGEKDMPYGGQADVYLKLLLEDILPAVMKTLDSAPSYTAIAGYSLAGLFALYAALQSNTFQAAASCSGSLWFPGFAEYVKAAEVSKLPKTMYFSLGDREAHGNNQILNTVEDCTRDIATHFTEYGVDAVFEKNRGNHFKQVTLRTAKGLRWILERM